MLPNNLTQEIYKKNFQLLKDRRHAEELLYNVSEGVLAVDDKYVITIFNNALEKMLGKPRSEVLGEYLDDTIQLESEHGDKIDLKQYCFAADQKSPALYDVVLKHPNKKYFVNVKFSVIRDETNDEDAECLITISDITKEIMLDKAKDDFLSLASHELKTPLTIIKGYLWMLQNKMVGSLSPQQNEYVDVAYTSTEQMIAMVNDMLNISRLEQGRLSFDMKGLNLLKTIKDAIKGFEIKTQEKNIYLKTEFNDIGKEALAYYDEGKMRECLINLVGNAIKFTKEGGVTLKIENQDDFYKISVTDTGVGISDEEVTKLFQKFGKGESSYIKIAETGGTGLGLYIVKIFIEAMGGNVGYSSPGDYKGSVFWITVPKHTKIHD